MKFYQTIFLFLTALLIVTPAHGHAHATNHPFSDVSGSSTHYDAIMELTKAGTINGYEDGTFRPANPISRQHVALILFDALELETPTQVDALLADFSDVKPDHPYAEEIAAVAQHGIFQGNPLGKFNPTQPITREQMASVLYRTFHLNNYDAEMMRIKLDNVDPSHKEAVQTLANLGITVVVNDFMPRNHVTRGQFATFLVRTLDLENHRLDAQALEEMIHLVNEAREEVGAGPLKYDKQLIDFSQFRADDMALNHYFSHDSPIHGTFNQMFYQYLSSDFRGAGENISAGYRSVEGTFIGWMNSPGHRANILDPRFDYFGFAYHPDGHYWVQVFGIK